MFNDMSIYILLCIFNDFAEKTVYKPLLVVESHHADFCSLPLFVVIQLSKSHIISILQAIS